MKIGDKVFVMTSLEEHGREHCTGTIVSIEGGYFSVKFVGRTERYMAGACIKDTTENRILVNEHITQCQAWRKLQPNVYQLLNRLEK